MISKKRPARLKNFFGGVVHENAKKLPLEYTENVNVSKSAVNFGDALDIEDQRDAVDDV